MLMDANIKQGKRQSAVLPQVDPMVISYGGVGRTSVLITYREVLRRENEVHDKQSLDKVLTEIIVQGRQDRGPLFIHSEAQFSELREALVNALGLD